MRLNSKMLIALAALATVACSDDDGSATTSVKPAAIVRFVNAARDTGTVDFRFIDQVENLPTFMGVAFRGSSGLYQRVTPGSRKLRIFPSFPGGTAAANNQILIDTTITLQADKRYTLAYVGSARGNADALAVIEEDAALPTPGAGQIAVKALHVAQGTGAVDVVVGTASPATTASVATIANVAYLQKSNYVNVAARPAGAGNLYTFTATTPGTTTALFSGTPNQPGIAAVAGQTYGAQGGVQIAGSVLTAVVVPGGTAGSPAGGTAGSAASVILLIDKVF
jgi:hypothetical protein